MPLAQHHVDPVDAARPLDRALGDHHEPLHRLALDGDRVANLERSLDAARRECGQRLVVDALEQVEVGQQLDHSAPARYSCTKLTAIDPSPTAEATRFIDWLRTSPATNRPGMVVSSR